LPDSSAKEERRKILEKIGGKVVPKPVKKKLANGKIVENIKEETQGGILHWGRENGPDLDWFRKEIKRAYNGEAPKVLDPFAGGGAIPLEAMRLGCEVTAIDINPVAWFILRCTLEYPQILAGQKRSLPDFILEDDDFLEHFFKANPSLISGGRTKGLRQTTLFDSSQDGEVPPPPADLAWHIRAWGKWVLDKARQDLGRFYPTYADFEPLQQFGKAYEKREPKVVPLKNDGSLDVAKLNKEFGEEYLGYAGNPRWIPKPTVAYLWARTVQCKNCRATVPLLKTRWLCKKDNKRVVLTMEPNRDRTGVVFGVQADVPQEGNTLAQRREYDKKIGAGTMSRSGAKCPCCPAIMTMEDIRLEGQAGRLGAEMTAVVVDGLHGKEYRLPTDVEIRSAAEAQMELTRVFAEIPFGLPEEPLPCKETLGFRVPLYGFDKWSKLFTPRQLLALGTFVKHTRAAHGAMQEAGYPPEWVEAVGAFLASSLDRQADYLSSVAIWLQSLEAVAHTFTRFALPINWDFVETNPLSGLTGDYSGAVEWVAKVIAQNLHATTGAPYPIVLQKSAIELRDEGFDIIVTDPPYYDAIPYSDLMDFFYVWLRRTLYGFSPEFDQAFKNPLSPKWDHVKNDGELIDDSSRFGGDESKSKCAYEDGMFHAFQSCFRALKPDGRLVIVFAHKHHDAWEALVSAVIRAGFAVDGSWPIQTERGARIRAYASAALASSVWLVCKKRPETVGPGWDNRVLGEMHSNITQRLREFWDAGIRGPDFVWAATGPALEAFSKHPVVKKANEPGQLMTISEFLRSVRRIVVDFVVGRVLSHNGDTEAVSGLDDVTTYYLLHRHDFGMEDAPAGACILYAVSCGLSDKDLADKYDLLVHTGGQEFAGEEGEQDDLEED
jgi:adenine-specific DNA methylase